MAPLSQANCQGNQRRKQIKNARSIQIVSNSAVQGHRLSGLDWQVTADVWWPRQGQWWRTGTDWWDNAVCIDEETEKIFFSFSNDPWSMSPAGCRAIPHLTPRAQSSTFHALQINLLMDDTLHALPEVAVFFSVSAPKQMPSYTNRKLSVCMRLCVCEYGRFWGH